MSAVFDTRVAVDYLLGFAPARGAFKRFPHRAITVFTWVEIMADAPPELVAETREFLRSFERLAINEAISDRAGFDRAPPRTPIPLRDSLGNRARE